MNAVVKELITYPVKGLSGQQLETVKLEKSRGFPLDRAFAFARYDSGMDPANPRPMPKSKFLVLARDAALARLNTRLDTTTKQLFIQDGDENIVFDCATDEGMADAAHYLSTVVGLEADKTPNFIDGGDLRFTDVCMTSPQYMHAISIINLASVRALSDAVGRDVDPHRFRGNLLVDGWDAFSELEALDREIEINGVKLRILKRTQRCPATQVNLQTAERDMDVPALIEEHFGHRDMGVYAEVITGGDIKIGDVVGAI